MPLASTVVAPRRAGTVMIVEAERVLVPDFWGLEPEVRSVLVQTLGQLALPLAFLPGDNRTLVVPRTHFAGNAHHDLAELVGRSLRPSKRKARALDRVRARQLVRSYPERLDAGAICRRGHELADIIESRRDALASVLLDYETYHVARDETDRTIDLMRSLAENRRYFQRRIGEVAAFLPCNQPLYALACFGLVPALMARRVHVRIPAVMGGFVDDLLELLEIARQFPNLALSRADRARFVTERSAVRIDELGHRVPVTDAVIFTGSYHNAERVRRHFDRNVLFIVNGAGHNPLVITASANLERAVASAVRLQLYNQGQDCASPSAILVHGDCYEEFLTQLRAALREIKVGAYRDAGVMVGPLTRRQQLPRIQRVLLEHAEWLDAHADGVIRTGSAIVEPTIICKPLATGGNFTEHYGPLFFVQRYDQDAELARYFEDERYPLHAMYVTVFGHSDYVEGLIGRDFAGRALHDASTILRDTDLHAPGVERGTLPYGGYGFGASSVSLGGMSVARPTLPQRDLFELLVLPSLDATPVPARAPVSTPPPVAGSRGLRALEAKFFDSRIAPIHRGPVTGNTRVTPLVDGAAYIGEVREAMRRTAGPGDVIYVLAYQLDPRWNLGGADDAPPLAQLLATRAANGVDVRVILNGTPVPINPWRENRAAARVLRAWRVGCAHRPPLVGRVAVDGSGASYSGSHHQKLVVVRHAGQLTAFVSGMDLVPDHWDCAPHATPAGDKRWPDGSAWGWHDVGVRVRGDAVRGLWELFRARWRALRPAPDLVDDVPDCPAIAPVVSAQSVQLLRSAFDWKGARVRELYHALKKAIAAAERYIYIEDQFVCDRGVELFGIGLPAALLPIPPGYSLFGDLADRLRACPELEVIFVSSGKSDPIDLLPGPRNRWLTPSLRRMLARLSPSQRERVAVWRIDAVTVHSKLILIDDELAVVGSGNFRSRSFCGLDDELQVAFVADDGSIERLRSTIWAEHLELEPTSVLPLDAALAHWYADTTTPALAPAIRRGRLVRVVERGRRAASSGLRSA